MSVEANAIEDFEESEISGENGEMYLFQWLSSTEKRLGEIPVDQLKSKQSELEVILVKIIISPEPYPSPGRALRNVVARCLILLYRRGETRTLFDTLQAFLKVTSDFKTPNMDAFSCIGDLMQLFGAQYMSFMAEIATVSMKTFKNSSTPLLRYHALQALKKSLTTAKRAVQDSTFRDISKQAKSALTDKCLPLQRVASEVLIVLFSGADGPLVTSNDVDSIVSLCVKTLEASDQVTRKSLAQLVGHLLASSQVERAVPIPEPSQKNKKENETGDDDRQISPVAAEATKPLLTPQEMFSHLSNHLHKPNVTRKTRIGIFHFYVALLSKLGPTWAETNYAAIVTHLMTEIVSNKIKTTRSDTLLTRKLVGILLRDLIGVRMLSEQGQIGAIRDLANSYLKRWPAMMPGQTAPDSAVLVVVLREVAGLLQQLGNAPPPVQDALSDPLMTLLAHPNHTTRVNASWTLRCFCYSTPLRLPKTIITAIEKLQRDLSSMLSPASSSDVHSRALGHAYGLAALVSVIRERPLYVSYDVSTKVLDMAIQLLKRAGEHDVRIGSIEVEVSWILIASLMSLGPNFVRPHLPQLLVLWRNALPKPTSKDSLNNAGRTNEEWAFLLHVRESALGAIVCFLEHNVALVNLDVGRRIASVLSNALLFANNFIGLNVEEATDVPNNSAMTLKSREALLRKRVYQCFSMLGFSGIADSTQTTLLQSAVTLFGSPDGYTGSSVQAAIASSSGSFTSVWQSTDGYAYGVTFIEIGDDEPVSIEGSGGGTDVFNRDTIEAAIETLLRRPVLGGCEHDPLSLCQIRDSSTECQLSEPPPPATAVVDAAIELFAQLLPLQDLTSNSRTLMHLVESVRSPKFDKNVGRKAAALINASTALVLTLRNACNAQPQVRETFGSSQVTSLLSPFLKDILIDGDPVLRAASSESIGRLASLAGSNFFTAQITSLVEQVVSNRDPYARSGCALAFGAIYGHVGGLAAGSLLKTIVNILMSLSNDTHPVVHFWALKALARVVNAASLSYSPYVSSTLGMLLKIYSMNVREPEGGNLSSANLSGDHPAYPVMAEIIDAVINVLGPDMQESVKTRALILNLVQNFFLEDDEGIKVEAIKCYQHFLMFASEHVNIPDLVESFRSHLASPRRPLKVASINALYQLVQKDALAMSKLGGDRLVEDLFGMLDDDSSVEGVRNVIASWLQQTVIYNPSAWIDLCQRIMARTTASQQVADASSNARDDEGESLNVGGQEGGRGRLTSRWRTQLFALQCLHSICTIIATSGRKEHLDVYYAKSRDIPTSGLLVTRVGDLIKMAFTASTAYVTEIRLEGLVVLRDVIQIFSASPDPAFEDSLLLEQHQAPITAALTPAFSADSTPEILASAVHACAIFVGCGVVKDVSRMGRILKLLTVALEQSKESGMVSLGEAGELSPNASAMLRISTLSAWAQLEVASYQQQYLVAVIKPYRATLASMWIASLRDYASIRIDSESLQDTSTTTLDSYSSMGKEVLLPYYASSWMLILQAVAAAMRAGDPNVLAAMDGRQLVKDQLFEASSKTRDEPALFFYVIFGLVYEALSSSTSDSTNSSSRQASISTALQALKSLVKPEYAGKAILEPTILDEFISVCYRIAMTETASIQVHLVEVLAAFASTQDTGESASELITANSPRSHCLRICAHIVRHSTSASHGSAIQGNATDRFKMIQAAFSAFTSVAASTNTFLREDVRAVAILLYSEILKDESPDIDLAGPTFSSLKSLLDLPPAPSRGSSERYQKLIHGLLSDCLRNIDEMRGREGVACTKKVKNNLLATVLILTSIPPHAKVGEAVIEHCCYLISQKILETGDGTLNAVHCAKTLITASTSGTELHRYCVKLLLPTLIEYIAKMAPRVKDGSITESHASAIGEIWKAFFAFFSSLQEAERTRLLAVFLPTIALLLSESRTPTSPVVTLSIKQLLTYATSAPTSFKEATGKLDASTRELLEQSIRKTISNNGAAPGTQSTQKPQISLRSF
ncbi:clathrin-coated vesicle protein [Marasmius fiardii PR-910]|nr:clathrin-coated vesicle protein [Marasmius fiardii PR-910]